MAWGNADIVRRTVAMLVPSDENRVLEIGFGLGVGVELLARVVTHGYVAGIDPSSVMREQARRRNRVALAVGRVDLRLGSSGNLPWPSSSFDKVCAMNNVMLWNLEHDVSEVRRVLKPRCDLVVSVHATHLRREGFQLLRLGAGFPSQEDVVGALCSAGFVEIALTRGRVHSGPAIFIAAKASPIAEVQ